MQHFFGTHPSDDGQYASKGTILVIDDEKAY